MTFFLMTLQTLKKANCEFKLGHQNQRAFMVYLKKTFIFYSH